MTFYVFWVAAHVFSNTASCRHNVAFWQLFTIKRIWMSRRMNNFSVATNPTVPLHAIKDAVGDSRLRPGAATRRTRRNTRRLWFDPYMYTHRYMKTWRRPQNLKKVIPLVHILHCTRGITFWPTRYIKHRMTIRGDPSQPRTRVMKIWWNLDVYY